MSNRKYCGNCGNLYQRQDWPRHCGECGEIAWKNPIPATFLLQPIYDPVTMKTGLAIARRAINPHAGEWAFMGGYVDMSDSDFISAAKREFQEESRLDPLGVGRIVHTEANGNGIMMIAVLMSEAMNVNDFITHGQTCPENHELGVMWHYDEYKLCFSINRKVAQMWFDREI